MAETNQNQIFTMLAGQLREWGLGSLFTVDSSGRPGGWLWDQLRQGIDTAEELAFAIQSTDAFRNRFGVIVEQQRRASSGQPGYVMSPAEVLEYEQRARQLMASAGMPQWFYDQPTDFHRLILEDMSLVELERRLVDTFEYVSNAPAEVRQAFSEFYGVGQADAALAAFVLDPNVTTAQLERARRTAYAGGMARRFDIQLDQAASERLAELPMTEAGIVEGLRAVASQENLFNETLFEATDLSAENEGIAAVFEGNAQAARAIERRQISRSAVDRANTGGAVITNEGLLGARTSGGG